jgi:predicted flap endonuclease-1-like 5' DNA nuclease
MTAEQLSLLVTILLLVGGLIAAVLLLQRVKGRRPGQPGGTTDARDPAPAAGPSPAEPIPPALRADVPSPWLEAPQGEPDDLMRIKGIGPKLSARLKELGVHHYAQIAAWTPEQMAVVDAELGTFQGRPERDRWQEQARLLASGDLKAFERMHGKLGEAPPPPAPPPPPPSPSG